MEVFFPTPGSFFPFHGTVRLRGPDASGGRVPVCVENPMIKATCATPRHSVQGQDRSSGWHGDCTWNARLNRSPNGATPRGASTETLMRVEHRTGRTAVLLSLIGLIMAPGAAVAQQHDRPRIPIRVVMPSHSSITVHVADAPAQLPTRAGGDGVVITNMPASPRVTSIPVRPTAIAVESHATTAGAFPGGETTSIDEDGVAASAARWAVACSVQADDCGASSVDRCS